jgi:hypothetical protein
VAPGRRSSSYFWAVFLISNLPFLVSREQRKQLLLWLHQHSRTKPGKAAADAAMSLCSASQGTRKAVALCVVAPKDGDW